MALQRINVGYGALRVDGNIQVVTNTGNVYIGNVTYPVGSLFVSNINTTGSVSNGNTITSSGRIWTVGNIQSTSNTTGDIVTRGGIAISQGNLYIGGSAGNAVVATGNINVAGHLLPITANATYNIGSVDSWWNTFYGVSTQAKYADLAENYVADRPYAAGTVLDFGGDAEVTRSEPDSVRVAGVVSSNPAHLMNGALQGPNVVPVALMGRVPCQVVGPVAKGDMMISAGFGYAKASANPLPGQVIGKALADVTGQTKATIEIVVGRV